MWDSSDGVNPRPPRYKRGAPTNRAPGAYGFASSTPGENRTPIHQLRRLALYPLSYRGWCERPWQDSNLQPPVPETGALSVALQGHWGDRRELNPSIVESQSTVLPLHHDRHDTGWAARCGGGGIRTPNRV